MSLPAASYGSPEQAAELVFSHELSTGALWESIRMMGGAYGAFAHPNSLEGVFSFSTYRDPDPIRSLGSFPAILEKRSSEGTNGDNLEKVIIGAFARETRPHSPQEKGFSEFLRRLYGINDDHRLSRLKWIAALTTEETNAAARRLADAARAAAGEPPGTCPVIIAGSKTAERAAKKLGLEITELPV
jgi:Zn-dependent M16 (insulinase) family peptidase